MMKTNSEIEKIVDEVLIKYAKQSGVYKSFHEIMKSENIKFKETSSTYNDFVGAFTKANNGQLYIIINKGIDNCGRKNFTIAHELGHYFLSHNLHNNLGFCTSQDILEEGHQKNPIEREANYFASCLLMPESKVKDTFSIILNRCGITNGVLTVKKDHTYKIWKMICDQLTKELGVSETALRYRMLQLKLAKFEFE